MDEFDDVVLIEIIQRIVAVSDLQQLILFGSQARGEAGRDSDLDILVVKAEVESLNAEAARNYRALAGLTTPVDIVVARSGYVQRHRDVIGTIVRPALREERVLYAR